MSKVFRILTGLTVLICSIVIIFTVFIYFSFTSETIGSYFKYFAKANLTKEIEYQHFSFSWSTYRNITVSFNGLKVFDSGTNDLFLEAGKVEFELDISAVPFGVLGFKQVIITDPLVRLKAESLSNNANDGFDKILSGSFWVRPEFHDLAVQNGTIVKIVKNNSSSMKEEIIFSDLEIKWRNLGFSRESSFEIKGNAGSLNLQGSFKINGSFSPSKELIGNKDRFFSAKFSDCPVNPFLFCARYFGIDIPVTGTSFSFAADAKFEETKWLFSGVSIISGGVIEKNRFINSRVSIEKIGTRFKGALLEDSLSLDLQEISFPGALASLKIVVKNFLDIDPYMEMTIERADIDLEKISVFLPTSLFLASEKERLKQADLKGHIQIANSYWAIRLNSILQGDLTDSKIAIDAVLERVSGFFPGFSIPIKDASGFVRLNNKEALFKGINLSLGNSPVVINGWISDFKNDPKIDIFLSSNANASDVREILLQKYFLPKTEFITKRLTDFNGAAAITLDVKGPLSNPSLKGRIRLEEIQFQVDGLPLSVRKVYGDIRFRGSKITFSGIRGLAGESPFEIKGDIGKSDLNLKIDLRLGAADLRKFSFFPTGWTIFGNSTIALTAKGPPSGFNFNGTIDFSQAKIIYEPYVRKKFGQPVTLEFSGVKNNEGVSIDEGYLVSQAGRISTKAVFKEDGKIWVIINLPPKGIPTAALAMIADPLLELQSGGRIEGDFSFKKERNQEPNIETNIIFSHITLRLPNFRKITEGITGVYQRKSKFTTVSIDRSRTGSSQIALNFSIIDSENPKLKFSIESDFLDTTDFTAPPNETSPTTWQEWIRTNSTIRFLTRCQLQGNLHIAKGKTALRTFDNFRSEFEGSSGLIKAQKWQMSFADGFFRGSANLDVRPQTMIPLGIDFQGEHLKFDRIFVSDPQRVRVDGEMSAQGHLDWKIRPGSDNHGIYKQGIINASLTNGIIYRFEILSKIFSFINLGSLIRGRLPDIIGQGLPYQKITWKMDIFDNKWQFKNLKIFSDATRVDASGMYFADQNRVDFKVKVSPLVGLDAIVSGLFGNLITKDGKILTTTFRVRGLYNSPDIRLEPFENFKIEN
jgi:hypothetical protein